jgi:hypothetical protein
MARGGKTNASRKARSGIYLRPTSIRDDSAAWRRFERLRGLRRVLAHAPSALKPRAAKTLRNGVPDPQERCQGCAAASPRAHSMPSRSPRLGQCSGIGLVLPGFQALVVSRFREFGSSVPITLHLLTCLARVFERSHYCKLAGSPLSGPRGAVPGIEKRLRPNG